MESSFVRGKAKPGLWIESARLRPGGSVPSEALGAFSTMLLCLRWATLVPGFDSKFLKGMVKGFGGCESA